MQKNVVEAAAAAVVVVVAAGVVVMVVVAAGVVVVVVVVVVAAVVVVVAAPAAAAAAAAATTVSMHRVLKALHFADVTEIQEVVTVELKKVQKQKFSAAFQKLYDCTKAYLYANCAYFE